MNDYGVLVLHSRLDTFPLSMFLVELRLVKLVFPGKGLFLSRVATKAARRIIKETSTPKHLSARCGTRRCLLEGSIVIAKL